MWYCYLLTSSLIATLFFIDELFPERMAYNAVQDFIFDLLVLILVPIDIAIIITLGIHYHSFIFGTILFIPLGITIEIIDVYAEHHQPAKVVYLQQYMNHATKIIFQVNPELIAKTTITNFKLTQNSKNTK